MQNLAVDVTPAKVMTLHNPGMTSRRRSPPCGVAQVAMRTVVWAGKRTGVPALPEEKRNLVRELIVGLGKVAPGGGR